MTSEEIGLLKHEIFISNSSNPCALIYLGSRFSLFLMLFNCFYVGKQQKEENLGLDFLPPSLAFLLSLLSGRGARNSVDLDIGKFTWHDGVLRCHEANATLF